jgi:hypothetical protein
MSQASTPGFRVLTLLRGEARRAALPAGPGPGPLPAPPAAPAASSGAADTIYGVPVSAVQSCCGRGCKHCRIYWHRLRP